MITFEGFAKNEGSSTSPEVDLPAGAQEGDFALLVLTADSSGTVPSLPSGFTLLSDEGAPNSVWGAGPHRVGYRVLGTSEPTTYTGSLNQSEGWAISITLWRGVDTSDPFDVPLAFNTGTDSGPLPDCPSVTTTIADVAVLNIVQCPFGPLFGDMDSEDMYTPPAGVTEVVDANHGAGSGYAGHAVGWFTQASPGATGTQTWEDIDNDKGGYAGTLTLKPEPTTTTVTGEGTIIADTATLSGSASKTSTITGSATLTAGTATLSGTATRTVTVSPTLSAGQAATTGQGVRVITAQGAISADRATAAGAGTNAGVTTAQGAIVADRATAAGQGVRGAKSQGPMSASIATATGAGSVLRRATGVLQADPATLSGLGSDQATTEGVGTLAAGSSVVSGTATRVVAGLGAVQASPAEAAGFVGKKLDLAIVLAAGPATLVASAEAYKVAAGQISASLAQVSGAAVVQALAKEARGALQAAPATVTAVTRRNLTIAAVLAAEPAEIGLSAWIQLGPDSEVWSGTQDVDASWSESLTQADGWNTQAMDWGNDY